jgi:hypothetical protein
MNTIVLNTLTGAVSEYTGFDFDSITSTHAGSALGLYELGGDADVLAPIVAQVVTGKTEWGDSLKKRIEMLYFTVKSDGEPEAIVRGAGEEWRYAFPARPSGQSRAKPGRGIYENLLAFGFSNPDGADFELTQIEAAIVPSSSRRV